MKQSQKDIEELKILPVLLYIVLIILFFSLLSSLVCLFLDSKLPSWFDPVYYIPERLLYFGFVLYLYIQIRILNRNKFIDQGVINKLITRFRLLGLLFLSYDIIIIITRIIFHYRNFDRIAVFFSFYTWNNSIIGIILLSLAEIIYLGTRYKEENDLTV